MAVSFQMKIAVCDDDEKDRQSVCELLREYLEIHDYHIRIDSFTTGEAFLSAEITQYSLVILDIFMGGLNGIETAKRLMEEHPNTQIIFCSTSNAYAAESYDVSALRYFIKPVSREKLFGTLDRFFHVHTALRSLKFKQNRMDESIYLAEILWIEADGHRSIIHTRDKEIVTRTPFAQLGEQVQDADFVKPIRYALVSLRYMASIPGETVTLTDGTCIPVSREHRAEMKKAFSEYKMRMLLRKGGVPL